jgi:hypothetical protein
MDKKAISERLRALAASSNHRSKAALLRDVIDDVEAALAAGISRSSIVEALSEHGLEISLSTFDTTLKRIRQKRGKTSNPKAQTAGQPPKLREPSPTEDETEAHEENPVVGSHNPADLDKIIGSKPDLAALAKLAKRKPR